MTDDHSGFGGPSSNEDDLIEIDLNFESMRRFQAEFSPNLSKDGLFIDTGEPLSPGSVVRFRVILPEEFVFLEGTAVVEWIRGPEAVSDGTPGMALRFVTLSSQNQELVEQLVQDHVDAGGTAFDFDVRPVPSDFPTDALEGAPAPVEEAVDEGYRLTVRRTGPSLQAEALQALSEAAPDAVDPDETSIVDEEDEGTVEGTAPSEDELRASEEDAGSAPNDDLEPEMAAATPEIDGPDAEEKAVESEDTTSTADEDVLVPDEARGFAILSKTSVAIVEEELQKKESFQQADTDEFEVVSEPPSLDWTDEASQAIGAEQPPVNVPLDLGDPADDQPTDAEESSAEVVGDQDADAVDDEPTPDDFDEGGEEPAEEPAMDPVSATDELPTPVEFESGPEIIGEIVSEDLGGPAFDVSLPEPDDGPDTTPVLPDEESGGFTVQSEEFADEVPPTSRRLWPFALVAVFVLAVAGGFLWPRLSEWSESRRDVQPQEIAAEVVDRVVEVPTAIADPQPETDPTDRPEAADVSSPEVSGSETEAASGDSTDAEIVTEDGSETESADPTPEIALPKADALISIEIEAGPRGTVIRMTGNGSLEDGAISMEPLTSPPRVLVRVRGIQSDFRPYTIESETPEVTRVRSGLHAERRPSELWVVVDVTGAEVKIGGIDIRRDVAEIVLSQP